MFRKDRIIAPLWARGSNRTSSRRCSIPGSSQPSPLWDPHRLSQRTSRTKRRTREEGLGRWLYPVLATSTLNEPWDTQTDIITLREDFGDLPAIATELSKKQIEKRLAGAWSKFEIKCKKCEFISKPLCLSI